MNYIFSKNSLMILESLSFTDTLYAFDFDGTLSKIVRKPEDALVSKSTLQLLKKLTNCASVAIVSGRGLSDLKKRVPVAAQYMVGNHGLEGLSHVQFSLSSAQKECRQWKQILTACRFDSGVEIEDKTYSLSIHYRRARNKKNAKLQIHRAIQKLPSTARVLMGKCVFNLLPNSAPHKGVAVLELIKATKVKNIFYIGDDHTDEDVFALPNREILSVRVGKKNNSQARFFINRQSEINKLLKLLIEYYEKQRR